MNTKTGKQISTDKRFIQANREAILSIALAVLNFIWWYAFAYGLGSKPVREYDYILGMPSWFFFSCVSGFAVFSFLAWVMVTLFFKEMPLNAVEPQNHLPEGDTSKK